MNVGLQAQQKFLLQSSLHEELQELFEFALLGHRGEVKGSRKGFSGGRLV